MLQIVENIVTAFPSGVSVGDRIKVAGKPRAILTHVEAIDSDVRFSIRVSRRPSRGFRKHLRAQKSRQAA